MGFSNDAASGATALLAPHFVSGVASVVRPGGVSGSVTVDVSFARCFSRCSSGGTTAAEADCDAALRLTARLNRSLVKNHIEPGG